LSSCRSHAAAVALLAVAALGSVACGHVGAASIQRLEADPSWVVVRGVPVVRQRSENDCGAAALASGLSYLGRPTSIADVTNAHPPKPGGGIPAGALRDVARQRGVSAFVIAGTVVDLERELGRGRPVIVGLVKDRGRRAYSHYAVVIGLERNRQNVLVIDPDRGWQRTAWSTFAAEWAASGQVTLVLLPRAQ
jgi:ABC-type bacteriocin/lantibiotic exporter with double-glycine peptidase domain